MEKLIFTLIFISALTPLIVGPLLFLLGLDLILIIIGYGYKKLSKKSGLLNFTVKAFKWILVVILLLLAIDMIIRTFVG